MTRRATRAIVDDLRRLALELDQPQPLEELVLRVLADGARASGTQIALLVSRRRSDVLRAIRELAAAGRLRRIGPQWEAAR